MKGGLFLLLKKTLKEILLAGGDKPTAAFLKGAMFSIIHFRWRAFLGRC
jgi:hypothetical protein